MISKSVLKFIISAFLLGFILIFLYCAVNPVTGKRELMLLSESDEIQLGKQTDSQVVESYGIYDHPDLTAYITQLGNRIAVLSHRPNLKYEFRLLDSPVINAFAVPGGYIYITRGILAYLNSESEFAGVLGHEIGHVTARHSAKQYTQAQMAQLGLGVGMIFSEKFRQYANLTQFGVGLLFLRFSRDNERQADELGVEYSTKAGYDATHMANFFVTLEKINPEADQSGLPAWFSTHPNPADRVNTIRKLSVDWQQKSNSSSWKVGRDEFLHHIDGIIFGNDPEQGYVENSYFYHPQMTFFFPIPQNWKLNNTPQQVQIISPKEDAVIILSLDQGSPEVAAQKFITESQVTVIRSENVNVNGFASRRMISDLASEDGNLRILSYFIQKDQNTYIFHGFSNLQSFPTYQTTLQSTMNGFRRLTDRSKIDVQPDRLKVLKITRGGSMQQVLTAQGVDQEDLTTNALINGNNLTDNLTPGTLIKVIVKGK
jgi:predicted Zn-dependent protease